ncbi:MAG TPA: RNA polymerase sigma-54 factor, partial [Firmicutes bacterium]|nr:RNA polymerase sigma-54 factor [Bacillota bacterium]
MRLDFQLEMRQTQKLIMTPQLQQAIKLLQLPALELSAYLEQQFLENPMLEMAEEAEGEEAPESEEEMEFDLDWEQYFQDRGDGGDLSRDPREKTTFEQYPAGAVTLQ